MAASRLEAVFLCREIQGNRSFAFVYAVPEPGNSIEKLTCKGWMA
jgi:hypothetical protein